VTQKMPGQRFLPAGLSRPTAGIWRVDPALSACRFDLRLDDPQPGGPPRVKVASSSDIDSRWVTRQRIPALGRRIVMTCSLSLEPDM
jgi:hypothetical protein